jgi:hypothetical protein
MQKQNQNQKQEEGLTGTDAHTDPDMMSGAVFEGTVPIPMRRPGRRYLEGEEPWFFSVQGLATRARLLAISGALSDQR